MADDTVHVAFLATTRPAYVAQVARVVDGISASAGPRPSWSLVCHVLADAAALRGWTPRRTGGSDEHANLRVRWAVHAVSLGRPCAVHAQVAESRVHWEWSAACHRSTHAGAAGLVRSARHSVTGSQHECMTTLEGTAAPSPARAVQQAAWPDCAASTQHGTDARRCVCVCVCVSVCCREH